MIEQMNGVQAHQSARAVHLLLEYAATNPDELLKRLQGDPRLRRLVWEMGRWAAETELEEKIDAVEFVASAGVTDDAKVDESRYINRTLSQIEGLHPRALRLLNERPGGGEPKVDLVDLRDELGTGRPLAEGIATDLLRLALAETGGAAFRSISASLYLAPFGVEVPAPSSGGPLEASRGAGRIMGEEAPPQPWPAGPLRALTALRD